ncbi:MAG: hypothetical protein ABL997_06090 [Planctomycetota bacterium]
MNSDLAIGPILAAFLFASLAAQEKPVDPKLVERTIARLDSADAKAAEAVTIALMRGDVASVPLLRAVLSTKPKPAVAERAQRALRLCEVAAPIENGLKTGLSADVEHLKPGESIRLTTTLCNVSDEPIAVYLGMSYSGNVLENGLAIARQDTPEADGEPEWRKAEFGAVGFCYTGAKPIVVKIEPWTTREFVTMLEFRAEKKPDDACHHDGPHLAADYVFLPLDPKQRTLRLRVRTELDGAEARGHAEPEHAPTWKSPIRSNVVEVAIGEKRGG